jgi:arylsulfatase A-like enzyme
MLILSLSVVMLSTWARNPGEASELPRAPNIVMILVDDLGWTDVGCFGSDLYRTPNVDRLAREGMRFTNAYAACTVCSPTRAALLTGKYPARLHLTDWIAGHDRPFARLKIPDWTKQLPLAEVTIAEALRSAGYATAHVGKWHLGPPGFWPTDQGFDLNIAGCDMGQPPSYYWPYKAGKREIATLELTPETRGQYLTDRLADEAARAIRGFGRRPFFLYLATYQVHMPKQPKPEYVPACEARVKPGMKHTDAAYAAMVQSMDELVGKVLGTLDELGIAEQTLVFFTGDNGGLSHLHGVKRGPTDNAPLRLGKGSAYEGGVRVPLVARWPGKVRPASVCREPVISTDFYPTMLEAAGAKGDARHNAAVDGRSLLSVLENPEKPLGREAIYWHYPHYHPGGATPYGAVRAGPWKLIEFYEDQRAELYNLDQDIGESRDLAAEKPDLVRQLRSRLDAWRVSVGAQLPTPNPQFDAERDRASLAPAKPRPKPARRPAAQP